MILEHRPGWRTVPFSYQNGRKTTVTSGHTRIPRMSLDLDTRRPIPCLKRLLSSRSCGRVAERLTTKAGPSASENDQRQVMPLRGDLA
jgi:hypothetical protein